MNYLELSRAAEQQQARDREAFRVMTERDCDFATAYKTVLDAQEVKNG